MAGTPQSPGSDEAEALVRSIAASRSAEEGPLLVVLQEIQRALGYIDPAWVPLVAHELNVSRAEVHGVITFYSDFRTSPPGRTTIRVCRAEACQSVGAHALAEYAQRRLGVGFGGTTPSGGVTLEQVFCLGNCALGPAVLVGDRLHGRVDEARFDALLRQPSR